MKQKNSVYRKWIFSYFILLCLSAVLNIVLYYYNLNILRTEVIRSGQQALESVQKDINNIFNEADKLVMQICSNATVNRLLSRGDSDAESVYSMYSLIGSLADMQKSNYYIHDFYLYIKPSDTIISSEALGKQADMTETDLQLTPDTKKRLEEILNDSSDTHTFLGTAAKNGSSQEVLILVQNIPLVSKHSRGAVIICINKDQLISGLNKYSENNFYIVDRNQNILPIYINKDIDLTDLSLEPENNLQYIDGQKLHVIHTQSSENNWSYISLLPDTAITSQLYGVKLFFYISLAVCLILGTMISIAMLRYNYKPFEKLLKLIATRSGNQYNRSVSEYTFIENAIKKISDENCQLNLYIKKQDDILRQNFINRMLLEGIGTTSTDALNKHNINVTSDNVIVGVIHFKDLSKIAQEEKLTDVEVFDYAVLIVSNITEELLARDNNVFFTQLANSIVFGVILHPENREIVFKQIEDALSTALAVIDEHFGFEFYTALSDIHSFTSGIDIAYREALSCMEYKSEANTLILFYNRLKSEQQPGYFYSFAQEKQLINLIKTGNPTEAERMLDEIFRDFKSSGFMGAGLLRVLIYDIASTMIKAMQDIYSNTSDDFAKMLHIVDHLLECRNTAELKEALTPLLTDVCRHAAQKPIPSIGETIRDYIDENYFDSNLSVAAIADKMNMHPNYLSSLFKEQMGFNILEYLTDVRLGIAKRLLIETSLTIDQISGKVGYTNAHTFTRVFKKAEGITPSQFRKTR